MISLTIPGLPKILSNGSHGHWRVAWQNATKWKRLVGYALSGQIPRRPIQKAHVVFTRYSTMEPDFDNLAISFKPCADALVICGVLANDKPSCLTAEYKWAKGKQHKGFITIEVRDLNQLKERASG
jgi:Holliday junction resolvase RusA-like endonuclease